ncbi:YgaP family membrane protein [Gemmatimonas sp. UBA7669]|uniref:YgaP family membrane protein n=1 Tax=Gemmatimonas sp. UBA7669 TaxID=1946568 RepID=UPI0025BA3A30|nr:DUF2892 domain-containing protein [Gemmatimonas sp. UBA7669]
MCNDKIIRRMAGIMVLLSVAQGFTVSDKFFWFTAFIGANLLQSSFTNFCLPEKLFARFGWFGCSTAPRG